MIMKKLVLLFALLFSVSTTFISCRETEGEAEEMELEETGDEFEDEVEDIDTEEEGL